jgi:molybdenum cofactor biosynthesis enzyme
MVDVGTKVSSKRQAIAEAFVKFPDRTTFQSYLNATNKKGDARLCAKIAGILAAKVIVVLNDNCVHTMNMDLFFSSAHRT